MNTCSYSIFFDHVDYFAKSKGIIGTVNLYRKDEESFVSEIEEVFYLFFFFLVLLLLLWLMRPYLPSQSF